MIDTHVLPVSSGSSSAEYNEDSILRHSTRRVGRHPFPRVSFEHQPDIAVGIKVQLLYPGFLVGFQQLADNLPTRTLLETPILQAGFKSAIPDIGSRASTEGRSPG